MGLLYSLGQPGAIIRYSRRMWAVVYFIELVQVVLLLIILVCRKNVLKALRERFYC